MNGQINENRCVTTSTVGYMCLALVLWMIDMTAAGWFGRIYAQGVGLIPTMSILLAIIGILSFQRGRTLDAIIFFGVAAWFWADYTAFVALPPAMRAGEPSSYGGWYWILWAAFFGWVWAGSLKAGLWRQLFVLGLWVMFLARALDGWTSLGFFNVIAGYVGLVTAVLAALISATEVIAHGQKAANPNDDRGAEHVRAA